MLDRRPKARWGAPAMLLTCLLTSCGSTVALGTDGSPPAGPGPDAGLTAPTGGTGLPADPGLAPPDGGGTSSGGAVSTPGAGGPAAGPDSPRGDASRPGVTFTGHGPGVTATTISVGLPYGTNGKAAGAAIGATGAGVGGADGKQVWTAALKLVNAGGGILGRKVIPVFHPVDATSQDPQASREQAACEDFTQDHKVFWVAAGPGRTLTPCLSKAGVSQSASAATDAGSAFYQQYPSYIEAGTLQMDRVSAAMPALLQQQGWFGAWNTATGTAGGATPLRVGIVSFDDSYTKHAINQVLVPALKRAGSGEPVLVQLQTPQGNADNASTIAAIQNATLRFRQKGVTHVIPFETNGYGIGVFMAQGADQQHYYPRYGVNSGNAVQLLIDQGLWPKQQLRGIMGFGWSPLLDLTNADNPDNGPYSNASRRRCLAVMQASGIDVSSAIVKRQALEYCTNLSFLKAALEAGGKTVDRNSFRTGAEALGTSFESALTFGTRFDSRHHDGVALVRSLAYSSSCNCMRYGNRLLQIA